MIGRSDFAGKPLLEDDVDPDPFVEFQSWFDHALASGLAQPNAMTLATAVGDKPSARIVLLKHFDDSGFVFFTNHESQKGQEITHNPNVALCLVWLELHRQVRIVGKASRIAAAESDEYFATRPRGAQVAATASSQSQVLYGRTELEDRFREVEESAKGAVARPDHWGGFRVVPETIEFWQGQPDRLHDRLRYRPSGSTWVLERLAP